VTGYKAGGVILTGFPIDQSTYGPEKATSYEVGLKSLWFDNRMSINLAVFDVHYDGYQLQQSLVDPVDHIFKGKIVNSEKSKIRGAEVDWSLKPMEDLTINANYAYLDAKITKMIAKAGSLFDPAFNPNSPWQVGDNIAGLYNFARAPRNAFDVGADYTLLHFSNGDIVAHVDYSWKDSTPTDTVYGRLIPGRADADTPSYGLLNARLTWATTLSRGDRAYVSLWGKNITNKRYPAETFSGNFALPNQTPTAAYPFGLFSGVTTFWAEPSTFGVNFTYEYGGR